MKKYYKLLLIYLNKKAEKELQALTVCLQTSKCPKANFLSFASAFISIRTGVSLNNIPPLTLVPREKLAPLLPIHPPTA